MLIAGAGGFARQLIDDLHDLFPTASFVFYNDVPGAPKKFLQEFNVINNYNDAEDHLRTLDDRFVLAVGGPSIRKFFYEKFTACGGIVTSVLSTKSSFGKFQASIGKGCTILSNCVIESTTTLGNGVLVNVNAAVTHDSTIGDFSEIGPGAVICGGCQIEEEVFIGAGAVILPGIRIGSKAIIGAGAVVNRDVQQGQKVIGVPAKQCK